MRFYFEVLVVIIFIHFSSGEYKRVCYVEEWARYRKGEDKFTPEDIDPNLCTHLMFAFATLDSTATKIKPTDPSDDPSFYKRFNDLKLKNPKLKTMLSVGGWSMGSDLFHKAVATDSSRNRLAVNVVKYLRSRNFDGIDVDWEFPAKRGSTVDDKHKFTSFLKALRTAGENDARQSGKERILVSAALNPMETMFQTSYEIPEISNYLDFINLMLYDLHGDWDELLKAAHHAPLYPTQGDPKNNIHYLASVWVAKGVPKSKLILGVPFYGKSFHLVDKSKSSLGSSATGGAGDITYREICKLIQKGAVVNRITDAKVPYVLHSGDKWTGYDDEKSLQEKMKYIINHGYGGAMVWALDQDDFKGACGKRYPLISAMKNTLEGRLIG
ncbi:hypothetical protein LOTGIDRAFT_195779 [Lottia gigantea]|uniref:GH18 domain-containing protein n=1 Tax=Lottia gigantea TaxID=225164 RepID=V3Z561_LOTGI|nr:hypothetical protein LOTGIDRAFT_195779 [Lottia gigantea]ESO85833.1 hypothetical protein LOTGIDRAFT_195779 [Lottia gigantea]